MNAAFLESLPQGTLERSHLLTPQTLLATQDNLTAYYIPFGYYPTDSKVALVGITPGFEQMRLAYETARDSRLTGDELLKACGASAGFGGPMRRLLVEMLDAVGILQAMRLTTSAEFFDAEQNVIRASVLRHPVFVNGENHTGHRPKLVNSGFLMGLVRD